MAKRGASPRHFHSDTVWWTAGPPPRNKLFTWTPFPLSLLNFSFCGFLLICDWSRLTPEIKYNFDEINKDTDKEWLSITPFHLMDSSTSTKLFPIWSFAELEIRCQCKGCMKPCCQSQLQRPFSRLCPLLIDLQINEEKYLVKCQYM